MILYNDNDSHIYCTLQRRPSKQKRRRLLLAEDLETDTLDRLERLLARGRGRLAKRHLGNELPR